MSPLDTPPDQNSLSTSELAALPSVQLFVERAAAARSGFRLTDQNAAAVAEICRHLDGLPLALELAAARIPSLSPEQIPARLHDRFRLLTTGGRTAPPRQRALRATLDWSFGLLTEPERVVLRRVAVFSGGWTLDAAEGVGSCVVGDRGTDEQPSPITQPLRGGNIGYDVVRRTMFAGPRLDIPAPNTLDVLGRLVARSLVRTDEDRSGPAPELRYRLLETVREYAWEAPARGRRGRRDLPAARRLVHRSRRAGRAPHARR